MTTKVGLPRNGCSWTTWRCSSNWASSCRSRVLASGGVHAGATSSASSTRPTPMAIRVATRRVAAVAPDAARATPVPLASRGKQASRSMRTRRPRRTMSGRLPLESPDARSGRPERASRVRRQRRSVVAQGEARDAGLPTLPCNDAQKRGSGRRGAPAVNEWVQLCAAPTPIAMGRLRLDASVRPMRSAIRRTFHAADPFLRVARVRGAHPPREAAKSVRCTSAGHGSSLVGWSDLERQWATAIFCERDRPSRFAHCESDAFELRPVGTVGSAVAVPMHRMHSVEPRGASAARPRRALEAASRSVPLSQHCMRQAVARSNPLWAYGGANRVAQLRGGVGQAAAGRRWPDQVAGGWAVRRR
jgi:hypothetical protein